MSDRLKRLREQRGVAVTEMRTIIEAAEAEKRDMTAEEVSKHEAAFKKVDGLRVQIEAEERTIEAERQSATAAREIEERAREADRGLAIPEAEKRQVEAYRKYLRSGMNALSGDEVRALNSGSDVEGGYLKAPEVMVKQLLKGLDNQVFMRANATVLPPMMADSSLGVPTLDADLDDYDWTTELQTGNEDTAMRFGKREMRPHPMAKRIKISKTLLRSAAMPIEQIVNQRMVYKLGITQEKAYLNGDGNRKPLGVYVASNDGIPTSRDVSTGNTTTAVTFDGLIEAKYALKAPYWAKARWQFHRDAVKAITKIKDADGNYIWRQSVRDGEADTILGRPLDVSEYVPNTFTTGNYVGMFADFSYYWIADSLDLQIQRVVELYAETNQDGFIARYEGDGAPVLAEAFARIKLA